MKATGIVRHVDDLGRIVIPKEIRRSLHIYEGEPLEMYVEGDGLVLKKHVQPNDFDKLLAQLEKITDCVSGLGYWDEVKVLNETEKVIKKISEKVTNRA